MQNTTGLTNEPAGVLRNPRKSGHPRPAAVALVPELRLIGRILGAGWTRGALREWHPDLFRQIDWSAFEAFAWQHKVRPMAAAALREAGWPGVPKAVRESLERDAATCGLNAIRQLEVHRAVTEAANAAGIRFLALKGLALSVHLYGDPLIRECFDVDLLVSPGDRDRMKELLRGLGFEPIHPKPDLSPRQTAILARFYHEEKFVNRSTGVVVDLHHALSGNPWRVNTVFEELWRNRQSIPIAPGGLSLPGDADLMRYLGAHAAGHGWERWKWAGDVVALCRKCGNGNLANMRRDAEDSGWLDLFDSSLLFASGITGWELPAEFGESAAGHGRAVRLARRALKFSARPATRAHLTGRVYEFRQWVFRLRLRNHPRHIAHELAGLLHRPLDWYEMRLADGLIPFYYLLRPVLFVGRRIAQRLSPK